jgi:hypothetical protein
MPLAPGTQLGPYVVVAPLGAGGMGEVYRARDPRLGREVAIKVLPTALASDPTRLERFATEARAAAALNHPNILSVHDVSAEGAPFVVFELLEGETLRERAGHISPRQAVDYAGQIARGLAAAHDKGVTHRDLKPDNVFVTTDGQVKILDFGLARLAEAPGGSLLSALPTREQTAPGTILGTSGYMAPEQVRGLPADHRADIFALGVLLYEMLTGQRAFQRLSTAETQAAVLRDDPPPAPSARPLPPALDRLVRRCLAKRPEDRFQSARDLVFALEAVAPGSDPAAVPAEPSVPSIAVLPFVDMSPGRDQDYFCEGLADELINALTRLQGVRVTARTSSFQFRGAAVDVRTIGERLQREDGARGQRAQGGGPPAHHGPAHRGGGRLSPLVGAVRPRAEGRLRHPGGDRRERGPALEHRCSATSERDVLQRRPTSSLEAYEFYLKGRRCLSHLSTTCASPRRSAGAPSTWTRASRWPGPDWPRPASGSTHGGAAIRGSAPGRRGQPRALELAPELAEVHVARGGALMPEPALRRGDVEFEAGHPAQPPLWNTYYLFGRMRFAQGRFDEAEALWSKADRGRPDDYQVPLMIAMIYRSRAAPRSAKATLRRGLAIARKHLEANPDGRARHVPERGRALGPGRQPRSAGPAWSGR